MIRSASRAATQVGALQMRGNVSSSSTTTVVGQVGSAVDRAWWARSTYTDDQSGRRTAVKPHEQDLAVLFRAESWPEHRPPTDAANPSGHPGFTLSATFCTPPLTVREPTSRTGAVEPRRRHQFRVLAACPTPSSPRSKPDPNPPGPTPANLEMSATCPGSQVLCNTADPGGGATPAAERGDRRIRPRSAVGKACVRCRCLATPLTEPGDNERKGRREMGRLPSSRRDQRTTSAGRAPRPRTPPRGRRWPRRCGG